MYAVVKVGTWVKIVAAAFLSAAVLWGFGVIARGISPMTELHGEVPGESHGEGRADAPQDADMAKEAFPLPVIMYHAVIDDWSRLGQYVISPAELESDFRWLQEHGYTAVLSEDLIAYVESGAPLPEKPVFITFDDGCYNNYLYAYPAAKTYGMKFVLSPIGKWIDVYTETPDVNPIYAQAAWEHLKEMQDSGLVEIGNHTYDMHETEGMRFGTKRMAGESEEQYVAALTEDLMKLQTEAGEHLGKAPVLFAYPFGAVSEGEGEIVKGLGFRVTLSCEEKTSVVTRDPESLYDLGRYLRPSGISSEDFFAKVLKEP